jgi:hypothetical protein
MANPELQAFIAQTGAAGGPPEVTVTEAVTSAGSVLAIQRHRRGRLVEENAAGGGAEPDQVGTRPAAGASRRAPAYRGRMF